MRVSGDYLVFDAGNWEYDIPLRDLSDTDGLEIWVCHMTEKKWFSIADGQAMVRLCERRFGYEYTGRLTY